LGMIAALRADRKHIESVRTETEIKAVRIYNDKAHGILANEIPKSIKNDVAVMIDTIMVVNEIHSLQKKLEGLPKVDPQLPDDMKPEVHELAGELVSLYKDIIKGV
ncbi:MAG: hypothetical protein ACE5EN_02620, partial [Nitrospinota bacterium]